jgi:hypothetical protein
MSPVTLAGFVKTRQHLFGRQSIFGTRVAAKRAYPFKGVPDVNPNWVDPEIDVGSIDIVAAPRREAPSYTAALTDPQLRYNSLPLLHSGFFGGAVAGAGSPAVTRLYEPASTSMDVVDPFTYEFGNTDVPTDWYQLGDGILESVEITGPEGLGALTTSMSWRFGSAYGSGFTDFPDSPVVPTSLAVTPNETIVYLKDMGIYIASDPYDVPYASARVADALHTFTMRWTREIDEKRFANGDQSFDVDAWGTANRTLELECSWAKTADIVGIGSESDAWFSEQAVDRYIRLYAESTEDAGVGVPYSWDLTMPMRYYTRAEGDIGGNVIVILTAKAFFAADNPTPVYSAEIINTLADANL